MTFLGFIVGSVGSRPYLPRMRCERMTASVLGVVKRKNTNIRMTVLCHWINKPRNQPPLKFLL